MTVFLMAFILPKFVKIYEARSASLPRPTKVLIAISEFVTHDYLLYAPVLLVLLVATAIITHRPIGRRWLDWLRLNLPVVGSMYRQLYLTRAARAMSTLLEAGVGLLDIIEICRGVTGNVYYGELWDRMDATVREGKRMSESVMESPLFPPNVASMIASGERSGRLADVMRRIADFAEEELDATVGALLPTSSRS